MLNNNIMVNQIIASAHLMLENKDFEPINKYNKHLMDVQHMCLHHPLLMREIPAEDAGDVGIAFLYLLDLTGEEYISVFPTYASISFFFLQKCLYRGYDTMKLCEYNRYITNMIKLMNIGARTFCHTVARAYNIEPDNYINFVNWQHLPSYVKMVLLMEYSYFKDMMKHLIESDNVMTSYTSVSKEARLRYNFLAECASNCYFDDIFNDGALDNWQILEKAEIVKKTVFNYVNAKIEVGDYIFR